MLKNDIACQTPSEEVNVNGPENSDEPVMSLASLAPTARHRRLVFVAGIFLFVAFATLVPFADTQLPEFDVFIPVSVAVMLIGVILNYVVPKEVFTWVTSIALIGTLWTWIIIMYAHKNYRRAVTEGRARAVGYQMPGWPFANWAVIIFLLVVAAMFALDPDTRVALYVAPFWFGLLGVAYSRLERR